MAHKSTPRSHGMKAVHGIEEMMANLTVAISHLSFAQRSRPQLFDLPQEIQEMIFDHAYPVVDGFKPISRWSWEYWERDKRKTEGISYTVRPFPPPKVSQFLVCKRFFFAAAKAFIGKQVFTNFTDVFGMRPSASRSHDVVTMFLTKAAIDLGSLKFYVRPEAFGPNLRYLKLTVKADDFDDLERKYPWEEELDGNDIKTVANSHNIERLAGIKEFHITHDACSYAQTNKGKLLYDLNVRNLGRYIESIVSKPRQSMEAWSPRDVDVSFPAFKLSVGGNTFVESKVQGHSYSRRAAQGDMKLRELPDTVEDMMALLKDDGQKFMNLVADLKTRESRGWQQLDPLEPCGWEGC